MFSKLFGPRLPLLRDGDEEDEEAALRSGAIGPFPVYLDNIGAKLTPQAIFDSFQASVGGVTYVETRRGAVDALKAAATESEGKLAAITLELEALAQSRDGVEGGGEGEEALAFGIEDHFARHGSQTIMADVDASLGPNSLDGETTKWLEWKAEQLETERAVKEERERVSSANPFLDDDDVRPGGEGGGAIEVDSIEAFLLESDNSAWTGGDANNNAAFTSETEVYGGGDEEDAADVDVVEEHVVDDTIHTKMARRATLVDYLTRKKQ